MVDQKSAVTPFKINQIIKDIIAECHSDDVGLWLIVSFLKRMGIAPNSPEMRYNVIHVVDALLKEPDIVAMDYLKSNYSIWNISPQEVIARMEKEWDALGHDPSLTDKQIVFFVSKELAQKYMSQNK